ncbi:MAG TPA: DUF3276 family protein [Blastocatellia bacterium]|nr:DUF3276 family protein [Blastocatellia bacterium]
MREIFSEKVVANRRTYYFDVKETREGAKYLVIGELTQVGSELERHRVMVFEESLESFMDGLDKAVEFILAAGRVDEPPATQRGDVEEAEEANEETEEIKRLKRIERKVDEIRGHFK